MRVDPLVKALFDHRCEAHPVDDRSVVEFIGKQQNEFKTNIRGLKVRGTYNTKDEADKRAKKLQSLDSDFHVFVGQVGYWLPWDPCADKIEDEQYINSQLNAQKYDKINTLSQNALS